MNKRIIVAIVALFMFAFVSPSFAGKYNKSAGVSYMQIQGEVIKLISKQGALIVKDKDDGKEFHIHVDKDTLNTLRPGDVIEFNMQGSNCVITSLIKK